MISYLKGKVLAKASDSIILGAGQVGYKVFVSPNMLSKISEGSDIELYTYLHLRQDETLELYGVPSFGQLRLFEVLRGVSGIGPKAALAISSLGTLEDLKKAIEKEDESFFQGIHGVGKKKIQKVILELTGKLKHVGKQHGAIQDEDALEALLKLGFTRKKAKETLAKLPSEISTTEERVKAALRQMRS